MALWQESSYRSSTLPARYAGLEHGPAIHVEACVASMFVGRDVTPTYFFPCAALVFWHLGSKVSSYKLRVLAQEANFGVPVLSFGWLAANHFESSKPVGPSATRI